MPFEIRDPSDISGWLQYAVELSHVEAAEFGLVNSVEWEKFKSKLGPSDELYYFRSPEETWSSFPLCGVEGYAIFRKFELQQYYVSKFS